jgi:hypothetical protein
MGFYEDMAQTARDLLAPTEEGGLGQGSIHLVRLVPGAPGPDPWSPPSDPVPETIPLEGVARGVAKELIGAPIETGGAIVSTDKMALVSVPQSGWNADDYAPTDVLKIDGKPVTVLKVENIPAAGTPCVIRFIVR